MDGGHVSISKISHCIVSVTLLISFFASENNFIYDHLIFHRTHHAWYPIAMTTQSHYHPVVRVLPWELHETVSHPARFNFHRKLKVTILWIYKDYIDDFRKAKVTALLPHREHDCCSLADTMNNGGCIYPHRTRAMEEFVQEVLAQKHIVISTSAASVGFFFMKKKGRDTWLFINIWGLNNMAKYPSL